MAKKSAKKPAQPEKPRVHKDLDGLDITINNFGELNMSLPIDKINEFLNRTVDDKKLRHRDDLEALPGRKKEDSEEEEDDFDLPDDLKRELGE
ncbi:MULTISPECIES: hypothetical protein [unclassified Siphonobacter]|uniref:hypothetical protein n=1 Tax=unclassified Siphonobacter TaxID=2635712 RepID=UPI000CB11FC5|nr:MULTISPECIES: hypothetical protein [unclassified Siphonobacter]MDQ1085894.1 hypothetical protein [Siphonobacter sp. SORGH_AS_1065]MDR6196219.1 hypothetical protein [Siphonobacter sp. SORGH_AS_0500]PKK38163.1 hypothetical protein BWI96_03560 [Siphonobacter sp. SORGH_AS_0500]